MGRRIIRKSVTRGRSDYTAVFETYYNGGRANGQLLYCGELEREFDVMVRNNYIAVDIGTGSGVKVRFRVEERH